MKTPRRLSTVLAVCATILLVHPGASVAADDDDMAPRRTQAEALLHAMHTEQVLTTAAGRVDQMVDKFAQNLSAQNDLTPEQKTVAKKAQDEAHTTISQQLSWDAVKSDFIQSYAEAFTEDELKNLTAFYTSPLGQKLVEKQPAVTEKMGRLTQQRMMTVMPAIMQKIKDATLKTVDAAPVSPAVAAPAPAAPSPAASPTVAPAP